MAIIDFIAPGNTELQDIDGQPVIEALTEEGLATALSASLSTGILVAVSPGLAERFGLVDHTDGSAEFADVLHADIDAGS